jgi:oxygen-independent coproporphyrinogen-3 oxidase
VSTDAGVRRQAAGPWVPGENLIPRPVESLSLYVHVPFCASRCRYCNFYFETGWSPAILRRTLDAILAESRAFRGWLFPAAPEIPPAIHTVYFGGGTPSIIPPAVLDRFLEEFRGVWGLPSPALAPPPGADGRPAEFAFEANPESLSPELLAVLGRHGVDRLSLGVQSFDAASLRRLGRRAGPGDAEAALAAIAAARRSGAWNGSLNLDLIVGIPGQGAQEAAADLERVVAAHPDHVSLYSLTEEPGTPLAQGYGAGLWPRPDPEFVEELVLAAASRLEAAGFANYEVSNFARPGRESLHNLAYWELRPYLGLGPGAVGTIPASLATGAASEAAVVRLTNPSAMAYARPGRSRWEHQAEILSGRDFLADHLIVGLRTARGLDLSALENRFRLPAGRLSAVFGPTVDGWRRRGLLAPEAAASGRLALLPAGRALLNPLLLELLEALDAMDPDPDSLICPFFSGPM